MPRNAEPIPAGPPERKPKRREDVLIGAERVALRTYLRGRGYTMAQANALIREGMNWEGVDAVLIEEQRTAPRRSE